MLMLDPTRGNTREKAHVTVDNHQKTRQKALKYANWQPVYNDLTFSVTAARGQQLSCQLGSCYGPTKHWAGVCNPLAQLLVNRHLEEGACLPLCVLMLKRLALSACHGQWQQRGEHLQVLQEWRKREAELERAFVLQLWKPSYQNEGFLPF